MPNKNYRAGRALEYEVMKDLQRKGFKVMRTAGSHGEFDVIAYSTYTPVWFIQCKRVSSAKATKTLMKKMNGDVGTHYTRWLAIKVKGFKNIDYYAY